MGKPNGGNGIAELERESERIGIAISRKGILISAKEDDLSRARADYEAEIQRSLEGDRSADPERYRRRIETLEAQLKVLRAEVEKLDAQRVPYAQALDRHVQQQREDRLRTRLLDLEAEEQSAARDVEAKKLELSSALERYAEAHKREAGLRDMINQHRSSLPAGSSISQAIEQTMEATRRYRASLPPPPSHHLDPLIDSEVEVRGQRGIVAGFIGVDRKVVVVLKSGERLTCDSRELRQIA